jgi:hypothetical protein
MVVKAGKCTSGAIFAGSECRVVSGSVGFAQNGGARYEPGVDPPERICAVMGRVAKSKGLSHNFAKCMQYTQLRHDHPALPNLKTLARAERSSGRLTCRLLPCARTAGSYPVFTPTCRRSHCMICATARPVPASCSPLTLTPACCPTSPTTPRNRCHGPLRSLSRPHPIGLRAASPPGQRSERR